MSEEKTNPYLNERSEALMVYKVQHNIPLMEEIFSFDPRNLEATPSAKISQYAIGLAQFLIFFTSQINKTKVLITQKHRYIEVKMGQSDVKSKTQQEKRRLVIAASSELQQIEDDIEKYECEIKMTENLEKYYTELINAFKRELSRREFEMKFSRDERRL
jgi:hypothetical protein